jgi:hypothetical protein
MTPDTIRKRAERQRRKEAGEVRVECWLGAESAAALEQLRGLTEEPTAYIIEAALHHLRRAYP